jgi:serine/alanine adding enzyme
MHSQLQGEVSCQAGLGFFSEPETDSPLTVEVCTEPIPWDRYVATKHESSNYHRWIWGEVVKRTYGHQCYRLAAIKNGTVRGVLPLCFVKSRAFGNVLISMPFFSYGGVVADDASIGDQLLSKAIQLAQKLGAPRIELRQGSILPTSWASRAHKVTMEVLLPATADELWKQLSSGMRNKIRNAKKSGLRVQWTGLEGVETFYRIFSTNMRNLGTPVYPRSWFANICRSVPEETRFATVWDGDEPVASGIVTSFRDTVELPWSGSLSESRKRYSAVLMYWSVLEWALLDGFHRVDLGRCTPGGGTYEFKRHFGCVEAPLHWYYWVAQGSIPETSLDNPRYRFATQIWRRLPLAVANQLGPLIVRSIP